MGAIKPFNYTHFELSVASGARALNHPCRVKMMHLINENPGITSIDLSNYFKMNKSTIYDHLAKLKDAEFITLKYHFNSHQLFTNDSSYQRFLAFENFFGQSPTECIYKMELK